MSQKPPTKKKSNQKGDLKNGLELANRNSSCIFLNTVVKDWNQALNYDIPALAKSASPEIDKVWDNFLDRLKHGVRGFELRILGDLQGEIPALETIKATVKSQVSCALKNISRGATTIHPHLVGVVQRKWEPAFRDALKQEGRSSERYLSLPTTNISQAPAPINVDKRRCWPLHRVTAKSFSTLLSPTCNTSSTSLSTSSLPNSRIFPHPQFELLKVILACYSTRLLNTRLTK